jgi:hypothetical protein
MIWYEERLVRALQQARWAERRERPSRRRQGAAPAAPVGVALRPAPVR